MIENIFEKNYAECLIARTVVKGGGKGEAIGHAIVHRLPERSALTDSSACSVLLHILDMAWYSRSIRMWPYIEMSEKQV